MSSKFKIILKDNILFICLVILFSVLLLWVPYYNLNKSSNWLNDKNNKEKINEEKIEAVLSEMPENMEIISKNIIDKKYMSVLVRNVEEEGVFESYIYDENGTEIEFENLFKTKQIDNFWNKVYELLKLKYPKFIVDGIKNTEGVNAYQLKENEMIIYFMKYSIEPVIEETISLKVNYNEIKNYINFSCKLDAIYKNEDGFNYSKNKKTIALSFDDGPSGQKTNMILKLLESNKATATFFMVGNKMEVDKSTVKAVYESGNEIGSHTYAHANLTRQTFEERMNALNKTNEIYKNITGESISLLRPPYGAYKKEMLEEFDYSVVLWDIDTEDWRYRDAERIVKTALNNLSDGSIILMHDSYNTTIEAVEKLLPILYAKGYQVVSVSKLAELKNVELEKNTSYRHFK